MTSARQFLRQQQSKESRAVIATTLGTNSLDSAIKRVNVAIAASTGVDVVEWISGQASNGLALTLELSDHRRIFAKFALPTTPRDHLVRVRAAQRDAHKAGFPCAQPLTDVIPFQDSYLVIDAFLLPRSATQLRDKRNREALASGVHSLSEFLSTQRRMRGWGKPLSQNPPGLWPSIDHPRLKGSARSNPWLDDLAETAKSFMATDPTNHIIGHRDWRLENVMTWGGRICAIYDWDALGFTTEAEVVGTAAILHPIHWGAGQRTPASPRALDQFISMWEQRRSVPFSDTERNACVGHAIYAAAVVAHHSYVGRKERETDPLGVAPYLRRYAGSLLRLVR